MSGAGSRSSGTSVDLPELPWSDWEIKADDIIMAKDADGSPVKLGSGAYGTVSHSLTAASCSDSRCLLKSIPVRDCVSWRLMGKPGCAGVQGHY